MKRLSIVLLALAILLGACSTSNTKMKSPRKSYYKTGEGKKKQKKYNKQYRGLSQ